MSGRHNGVVLSTVTSQLEWPGFESTGQPLSQWHLGLTPWWMDVKSWNVNLNSTWKSYLDKSKSMWIDTIKSYLWTVFLLKTKAVHPKTKLYPLQHHHSHHTLRMTHRMLVSVKDEENIWQHSHKNLFAWSPLLGVVLQIIHQFQAQVVNQANQKLFLPNPAQNVT